MKKFVVLIKKTERHDAVPSPTLVGRNSVKIVTGLAQGRSYLDGMGSATITAHLSMVSDGKK